MYFPRLFGGPKPVGCNIVHALPQPGILAEQGMLRLFSMQDRAR
jgi:hypothetical protein